MSMGKSLPLLLISLFVVGCVSNTSSTSSSEKVSTPLQKGTIEQRFNSLYKSCNMNKDKRLDAANLVMENIVKNIENDENPNMYMAGNKLYKLTGRFYRDNIDQESCRKEVEKIKYYYNLAYAMS